jgi:LPS export ABC transporter protein LptC
LNVTLVKALRRILGGLIAIIVLAVSLNYIHTWRQRSRIVKQTARILSTEMLRSADSIEYSENENGITIFKIRAERLLETRQGLSLLEGIEARDFNPDGTTRNQIRSRFAEYDRDRKKALFKENVRLQTGQHAELKTESLFYDLDSNIGETGDRIQFDAPQGRGTAKGVLYDHAKKLLILKNAVEFILSRTSTNKAGETKTEEMKVVSKQAYYDDEAGSIRFIGEARIDSQLSELAGDEIEACFTNDKKHIRSLECRGHSSYRSRDNGGTRLLQGDRLEFVLNQTAGTLERITAHGNGSFDTKSETSVDELRAGEIQIALDPDRGVPTGVRSQADVRYRSQRDSSETILSGDQLHADFAAGSSALEKLKLSGNARMASKAGGNGRPDQLRAEEILMRFRALDGRSTPQDLLADRSVKYDLQARPKTSNADSQPARSLSAGSMRIIYSAEGGQIESGTAKGNVELSSTETGDGEGTEIRRLLADEIRFHFSPKDNRIKEFEGDGNVRIFFAKRASSPQAASGNEFQTASSKMRATFRESDGSAESVSQWGGFSYRDGDRIATSGRCDYNALNEQLVLRESPQISDAMSSTTSEWLQYDRKKKVMSARGQLRSILQAAKPDKSSPGKSPPKSSSSSIITAEEMHYWSEEERARYTGHVQMLSESGQLQAQILDIFDSGQRVEAQGDVLHLISRIEPQNRDQSPKQLQETAPKSGAAPSQDSPLRIRCGSLQFLRKENIMHYAGKATVQSDDLWMSADSLDAMLTEDQRRIDRAIAKKNLFIRQGEREVQGDQCEYYLNPGKFIVTGNLAQIRDPVRGKSSARRLTFFTTDDRILLENR